MGRLNGIISLPQIEGREHRGGHVWNGRVHGICMRDLPTMARDALDRNATDTHTHERRTYKYIFPGGARPNSWDRVVG